MTQAERRCDVLIVGGGLVGASLAAALAPCGLSLAVVEPFAPEARDADAAGDSDAAHADPPAEAGASSSPSPSPSFDERTVALTYNARQIYTGIGVWEEIAPRAQPIREIHLSDRGHFGMAHLNHADAGAGIDALGYVVPSRTLGEVLHRRMRNSNAISLICPATVDSLQCREREVVAGVTRASGATATEEPAPPPSSPAAPMRIRANLAVLADGGRSQLAGQLGIATGATDYRQSAILSIVATDREHHGRAYERFTGEGSLALLPHSEGRYAVVWSTDRSRVAARMALSDAGFIGELQRVFGDRAGSFSAPSARRCHPLQHGRARHPVARRAVLIGNAAHTVHPVAGQGFNLGLRDVATLAEVIYRGLRRQEDIGGSAVLEEYAALRRRETARVSGFTDGLIRLFDGRRKGLGLARNLALAGIEWSPAAKRFLLRRTMGMAGARSRLGAGLPLAGCERS